MMAFGLEAMVAFDTDKTIVGPASRKYVEKVHARLVLLPYRGSNLC